ncbi:hypothetical protein Salat_1158100, partial [Sesamum alatum]
MASMKNLQDAWCLQFGDEVSPSPQALVAGPSRWWLSSQLQHMFLHLFTSHSLKSAVQDAFSHEIQLIAPPPGVFPPHFQANCSLSALQQLLVPQSAPLAPRSATLPPLMHEKSYKDALFSAPHSLPHASLPAANFSSEKNIAAFYTAVDSAPATFCTPENHAVAPPCMNENVAAVLPCIAANFAAHSSLPAANFWPKKTTATSSCTAANSAAHPSLPTENSWSEKTAATSSCAAAFFAAHSSLPTANFWSEKTVATSCATANSAAHSSLPTANYLPEKTAATSSCAAANSAAHPSLPADNSWSEKSDATSCATANFAAHSSLPAANFWPENSAPTSCLNVAAPSPTVHDSSALADLVAPSESGLLIRSVPLRSTNPPGF